MGDVVATAHQPQAVTRTEAPTPAHMLQTALEKGLSPDQLGQFMDLYERWESEQARKAYAVALVAAQGEMPSIAAKSWNDQTKSAYAKLDAIVKAITPVFSRHGISMTFSEGDSPKENHVRVLCDVTHESGHTIQRHIDMPIVTTGIKGNQMMTPTHATGSAFSYGRRYLTCMIANLSVGDDNDGNAPKQSQTINPGQARELKELIKETGSDVAAFLKAMGGAPSVDELPAGVYNRAKVALNRKKVQMGAEDGD